MAQKRLLPPPRAPHYLGRVMVTAALGLGGCADTTEAVDASAGRDAVTQDAPADATLDAASTDVTVVEDRGIIAPMPPPRDSGVVPPMPAPPEDAG